MNAMYIVSDAAYACRPPLVRRAGATEALTRDDRAQGTPRQFNWFGVPPHHGVTICAIRCLALTVLDVCLSLVCFQSTSRPTFSALEVLHIMRYINLRLTYLLTFRPNVPR